jgi:Rv0078B-related antitoxin
MSAGSTSGLAVACEMADLAAHMVAERYRREHPSASEQEIADRVKAWWRERPGAPDGDAEGQPRDFAYLL